MALHTCSSSSSSSKKKSSASVPSNTKTSILDTDQPEYAVQALRSIFPDAEPQYLEHCVSHYQSNIVARVCEKITHLNHGYYPKLPSTLVSKVNTNVWETQATKIEYRNHCLLLLSEYFPFIDLPYLKNKILYHPINTVYEVIQDILTDPKPSHPLRPKYGVVEPPDLFKCPTYIQASLAKLYSEFPDFWKSSIQAHFAEHNQDFLRTYRHLKLLPNPPTLFFPFTLFKRKSPTHLPTHPLLELQLQELEKERRQLMEVKDFEFAMELNEKEYEVHHQLFECSCCFSFTCFENLIVCENTHFFCRTCILQLIKEAVFGQQKSLLTPYGLKCCHASGCPAMFHATVLSTLEQLEPQLMHQYWQRIFLLHVDPTCFVRCLFCGYLEWIPSMPSNPSSSSSSSASLSSLPFSLVSFFMCSKSGFLSLVFTFFMTTLYHWSIGVLCLLGLIFGFVCVHHFTDFRPLDRPNQFSCSQCKKQSCLICRSEYLPHHQCFDVHSVGVVQYVESAMTNAIKRVCPNCSLCFTKSDGCNLIKCANCRYVMCYLCRKDIHVEYYDHFCRHFRMTPGRPCTQCQKCDLYLSENEQSASQRAGKAAYYEWKQAHPHVQIETSLKRNLKKLIDI